jgi:hypothetical protein
MKPNNLQINTQFKSLVQTELKRLEGVIALNELHSYPVAFHSYRSLPAKKQPSPYTRWFSFMRVVQFLF